MTDLGKMSSLGAGELLTKIWAQYPLALHLFSGAVVASGVVLELAKGCRVTSHCGISAEHIDVHVGGENDWGMGRGRSCSIVTTLAVA